MNEPLRSLTVGVVYGSETVPAWQARVLEALNGVEGVSTKVFVLDGFPHDLDEGLWERYWRKMRGVASAFRATDLSTVTGSTIDRRASTEHVDASGLDAMLVLAGDEPPGPDAGAIWSFRFGRSAAGAQPTPQLVAEVAARPVSIPAELHDRSGNSVSVLKHGEFRTAGHTVAGVFDEMYAGCADWPAAVCRRLLADAPAPSTRPAPAPVTDGRRPAPLPVLGRAGLSYLSWQITERLFFADGWNIGMAEAPISAFLSDGPRPPIRWFPESDGAQLMADPFGVADEEGVHVLAERWDLRTGAELCSIRVHSDGRIDEANPVEGLPTVASYPYLFRHGGETYCVPETAHLRTTTLFRALDLPTRWVAEGTLIDGLAAGDPTIFQYDDRWWLFCTDIDRGRLGRLLAFHSDELSGPWRPHAANPIKIDVRSSRPAGTPFFFGGHMYRPAQDCSVTYGGAVAINRITRLTPTDFEEEVATIVAPDKNGPYPKGLHTLSAAGDVTLVDGKRRRFLWQAFRGEVSSIARRRSPLRRSRPEETV